MPHAAREVEQSETSGRPSVDKSGARVRGMFGSIARRYDFLNHFLSLNIDKSWRRRVVATLRPRPGEPILDCCTGTADLALAYGREFPEATIFGTDFCRPMLEVAREKVRKRSMTGRVVLMEADTLALPFPDDTFGVVTVAFGLRNVADTARGIDEMIRVARPGGTVAVLEFSKPKHPVLGRAYAAFFRHVLPRVGQTIAPNEHNAYEYLPTSVQAFPEGRALVDLLASRGLLEVRRVPMTLGVATLYYGRKRVLAYGTGGGS